ncbi:hypothetical protein C1H46_030774 [Malus baccata]|uniref:Uncharacterized protein n=1 Tax=Malus baccata TaxID=106549 RepID=A0A540LB28_MALBA|nr:hypothetical protein C1H46_030774 [Malus baccata]
MREKVRGIGEGGTHKTFLEGFDLSFGAASGVDDFLILLGGGVGCLLPDDDGLPVLRDGSS